MDWLWIASIFNMAFAFGIFIMMGGLFISIFAGRFSYGLAALIVGVIVASFGSFCASYAFDQRPYEITDARSWNTTEIQNITCLSDGTAWSVKGGGHFVLGTGTAVVNGQSRDVYYYYKETSQGYLRGSLDAANVYIREDENLYPYIEWDYSHSKTGLKRFTDDGSTDYTLNGAQTDTLTATIIHVPNGTVYREFSVGGA
jgi:hypothetical protein